MAPQQLTEQHAAIVAALAVVPSAPASYASLDDSTLLDLSRTVATEQRLVATTAALIAGEMARRSAPELGSSGLAQRLGHRTPQELVRVTTGSTKRDATTAVAPTVDSDRVYLLAREQRDAIDEAGIIDRERHQREKRSFRLRRLPDGMSQVHWTLDPESAAAVSDLFDRATSPRRGGPRFVNPDDAATAQTVLDDQRTTEQLVSDVFLELLRHGANADSSQLLGTGAPVVRVLVSEKSLASGQGHAHIEGQTTPVSMFTFERFACGAVVVPIKFDEKGSVIDVGREQRLYTRIQRIALAARDGGCRWTNCDRPPSWCEAHHTKFWARDGGSTNLADGILLCRHHHLLLHNNGWVIGRDGGDYFLIPPRDIDPAQRRIPMPSKSAALRELLSA